MRIDKFYVMAMFVINEDTTAVWDVTAHMDMFVNCSGHQVQYSNDGGNTWVKTDIYLTDDASGGQTEPLVITQQPNDASAKLDEMFCVEVRAQGDGLKYPWYWRQIGSETWNVSGQRDNTYDDVMTSARHNREFCCVITHAWGNSVTTETVTLICATPPKTQYFLHRGFFVLSV